MEGLLKLITIAQVTCASHFWPSDKRECEDKVIICIVKTQQSNEYDYEEKQIATVNCLLKSKKL